MLFKITSFLSFLFKSTNQHGVHSPFVYSLATECFYAKTNPAKKKAINAIRSAIYKNKKTITITDFGSGSKVFKNNERKAADIARIAGISRKKACLLIRIIEYFKPQNILEIGTSVGLGTATLAIGNKNSAIKTLEGCSNTASIAQELFNEFNLKNIEVTIGNFKETLPRVLKNQEYDLIYFDGNHQKEATLHYFNQCLSAVKPTTLFIFDDINWSSEMQQAWQEIKNHSKVTVTIDTFFWGLVFFRKEQAKQHFTIRI